MNVTDKMDIYFHLNGSETKEQKSRLVNEQLAVIPNDQIFHISHTFGLDLITAYFNPDIINTITDENYIEGFVRYLDAYLIEASGGKRSKLIQIGRNLTGEQITGRSVRLIRSQIIHQYLKTFHLPAPSF